MLDLRGLNDATDYFVVASGTSDAHVRGLANSVMAALTGRRTGPTTWKGCRPADGCSWTIVDFVVHLFHPEARAFYQLERLWNDAPRLIPAVRREYPP